MTASSFTELAKTYDPAAVEAETYRVWLDEKCFQADPARAGQPYSIVIPPPNVTGALHLGHAINNTLQDILTRVHRMRGFNTVWIPGIDHAGIATQAVVEKQLKENENKTRHDVGRECLVKRIWAWKQQYGDRILNQLQRLGCSCDWSRTRFTLDEMCARAVRETFFKLFKDGLIYRGKRLVNWDAHLQTSISDDEIYHETVKTFLWHIKYPISGMVASATMQHPTHMTVATTRPETLLGDTAVAVHSQDPRWNWAIGNFVELPLTGRKIPIIADDILVDMAFGSGVVKVTPGHDPNDYAVYTRHLGRPDAIEIINLLNPDGTMNENAGKYAGLKRDAARKAVVADLGDLLVKEEPYETQVGHSDRSKTPVEPYLSDQWFVKMAPLAEPALEVVRDGTIKFFPERHAQQYLSWLGEKRDWPISRQLWWGHRIPVWRATPRLDQNATILGQPELKRLKDALGRYARETGNEAGLDVKLDEGGEYLYFAARDDRADKALFNIWMEMQPPIADLVGRNQAVVKPVPAYPDHVTVAGHQAANDVIAFLAIIDEQDPDVLDTWFSSALWPHSTLGWPEQTADLARWYPTSVLMTGRDIITLWVARMVMMGIYNMGERSTFNVQRPTLNEKEVKPSDLNVESRKLNVERSPNRGKQLGIPFHHVAINPTILDGKGERMSKSKGNGVDPVDIVDSHGADALRFTMTSMATETQDVRMPVQAVCPHCGERFDNPEGKAQVVKCPKCKKAMTRPFENAKGTEDAPLCKMTSKRFDEGRNFCTKLWNAGKFVLSNLESVGGGGGLVALATRGHSDPNLDPNLVAEATRPEGGPETTHARSLADLWIVSRFNRAVEESNTALASYRFDQYARACYDFFWRDFCDWYVEATKPALKDPSRSGQTADVLAFVLDGALRLMHPMIPFITERIWWQLNEVRPQRGTPPSRRLIHAAWPTGGSVDSDAEATFGKLQEIIGAIRNVRNEYKVDPKKSVTVSLVVPGDFKAQIESNRELLEVLAICTIGNVAIDLPAQSSAAAPANTAQTSAAGCDLFVEGVIDPEAEKNRKAKKSESLANEIAALKSRLANPAYANRAPAHLVQQTREELVAKEAELGKLLG